MKLRADGKAAALCASLAFAPWPLLAVAGSSPARHPRVAPPRRTPAPAGASPRQGAPLADQERDLGLVAAMAAGDRAALAELYERHASPMLGLAFRILGNRRDAEDLLHDVFIEAWQKARSYDAGRGTVRAWLLLRLRSRAIDRARALASAREFAMARVAEGPPPPIATEQSVAPDRLRARQALESLSKEQRVVVELAYFEGLSCRDAALRLGIPTGTVKSRLFAAMAKLRGELGLDGGAR